MDTPLVEPPSPVPRGRRYLAKCYSYRDWWSTFLSSYPHLCVEGSFRPYLPPYTADSRLCGWRLYEERPEYARSIDSAIRQFKIASFASQGSLVRAIMDRQIRGPRVMSPFVLAHTRAASADIQFHTPHDLASSSIDRSGHVFSDIYRLWGLQRHSCIPSYEPRITLIPACVKPDRSTWSPNARRILRFHRPHRPVDYDPMDIDIDPLEVLRSRFHVLRNVEVTDMWAQACSLRAQLALHSPALSHIMWDVGLFCPHIRDVLRGFASHTLIAQSTDSVYRALQYPWGAMLIVRPIVNETHLQIVTLLQGYSLPTPFRAGNPSIFTNITTYLPSRLARLTDYVSAIRHSLSPILSSAGIRVLDETDNPSDPMQGGIPCWASGEGQLIRYVRIPHPFGIEITIPTNVPMPTRCPAGALGVALQSTQGTDVAWIAEEIEQLFGRGSWLTVARSFQLDPTCLRVKLFLFQTPTRFRPGSVNAMVHRIEGMRIARTDFYPEDVIADYCRGLISPSIRHLPWGFPPE